MKGLGTARGRRPRRAVALALVTAAASAAAAIPITAPATAHAWVQRHDGGSNNPDWGRDVVMDRAGNVYVTGYVHDANFLRDIVTIKYDPSGAPSASWPDVGWGVGVRRYTTPSFNGNDEGVGVALDGMGNVYVAGSAQLSAGSTAYVVIKYVTATGAPAASWPDLGAGVGVRRYAIVTTAATATPAALAVSAAGNVFVTGSLTVGSQTNFLTVGWGPGGAQLWARAYDGPASGVDNATGIALDAAAANVYVTGGSNGVFTGSDYATIRYDAATGATAWPNAGGIFHNGAARYDGPAHGSDGASSIAVFRSIVYVTGASNGVGTSTDYATLRYTTAGATVWPNAGGIYHNGAARYDGPVQGTDSARALAVDAGGNVVVTGQSWGARGSEIATIRYTAAGATSWPAAGGSFHNGATRYSDLAGVPIVTMASGIALDADGNVFVTGTSHAGLPQQFNYVTLRYQGASGATSWVVGYDGTTGTNDDNASAIAVDPTGSRIVVTGSSVGVGTGRDVLTVQYDANGVP